MAGCSSARFRLTQGTRAGNCAFEGTDAQIKADERRPVAVSAKTVLGGTGDSPVPVGDPPSGAAEQPWGKAVQSIEPILVFRPASRRVSVFSALRALCCSADFQSISIADLQSAERRIGPGTGVSQRLAEYNSAIQRSAAKPQPKERGSVTRRSFASRPAH